MPPPLPCPIACAALGRNGQCDDDAGCNTLACLFDQGDCRDLLDAMLQRASGGAAAPALASDKWRTDASELVASQGGLSKQQLYVGIAVGLAIALACLLTLCCVRRWRRRVQSADGKYTPYGRSDDDLFGGAEAPRLESAVDDDGPDD